VPNPSKLAKEIKRLREAKGWSIRELSLKVPCHHGYLSRFENGELERDPSHEKISAIIRALGVGQEKKRALILSAQSAPTMSFEEVWSDEENREEVLRFLERFKE